MPTRAETEQIKENNSWKFAPNRSFSTSLKSPWFIVPEVIGDGLAIWDYKRSECKLNNPCHQFWSERGAAMIYIPAIQLVLDAKVSRPIGLIPVGILIEKSVYSLTTGRYR